MKRANAVMIVLIFALTGALVQFPGEVFRGWGFPITFAIPF